MLTLIEAQVRGGLEEAKDQLTGLYVGQPSRKVYSPTGILLLKAFPRDEDYLDAYQHESGKQYWHVTSLSRLQEQILMYLKLSVSLYANLIENSS